MSDEIDHEKPEAVETPKPTTPLVPSLSPPPQREVRVVNDPIAMLDTARFEHMQRIAMIMADTSMIPDSLRKTSDGEELPYKAVVANCFMVVNQAVRWEMDPFAVAQCCSVVHGRLMYEGKLVAAVLDAQIGVRLKYEFDNAPGQQLGVTVSGTLPGESEPRTVYGRVLDWHRGPKSPWAAEGAWKRQLRYMGAREWARAHAPATMLGVYADDELVELRPLQPTPPESVSAAPAIDRAAQRAKMIALRGGKAAEPLNPHPEPERSPEEKLLDQLDVELERGSADEVQAAWAARIMGWSTAAREAAVEKIQAAKARTAVA